MTRTSQQELCYLLEKAAHDLAPVGATLATALGVAKESGRLELFDRLCDLHDDLAGLADRLAEEAYPLAG